MKAKLFYIIWVLVLVSVQKVHAQTKPAKVVQDMAERRERREKQMAQVRLQVNEQKTQLQSEKMQAVQSSLPQESSSRQTNLSTIPVTSEEKKQSPGRSNTSNKTPL